MERLVSETEPLLIFSGDFVQAGGNAPFFGLFEQYFEPLLVKIGVEKTRRVFIPGNHDIARQDIRLSTLNALAHNDDDETNFNDLIYTEYKDVVYPKLRSYLDFEARFAAYGCGHSSFCGAGHDVGEGIGLYTLNTALFSFGGVVGPDGCAIDDQGLLRIETRRLNKWLQETDHNYRILVMHHPADHLVGWARAQIEQTIRRSFDLVLQGHVHMPDAGYLDTGTSRTLICTAPPLFTRKSGLLGYSVIEIDAASHSVELSYRQASRSLAFVSGSFFTDTDDGKLRFGPRIEPPRQVQGFGPTIFGDPILSLLRVQFETATTCHSSLGPLWVAPDIGTLPETEVEKDDAAVTPAAALLSETGDLIIKSPPLFGLTSLGHFLALEAWMQKPGRLYLVVGADDIPNHEAGIRQAIQKKLETLRVPEDALAGLIVDNILVHDKLHVRKIASIKKAFAAAHLVLLVTIDNQERLELAAGTDLQSQFQHRYLWAFDRSKIRDLARQYCSRGCALDEDALTQKIVDDLRMLNLYRTPLNCITLMRIADAMLDHTPVNRTEMIERFLFLIFTDFARLPKYGTVPDLKDSMYALGYLCEMLLRRNKVEFSKVDFFKLTSEYCKEKVIDLDVDILFGCLVNENILVCRDNVYRFRFSYWILFFAAQRMYHSQDFADFVLDGRKYARFPEVIEFYSGIARRRGELLERLRDDLRTLNQAVNRRVMISENFNPYDLAKWRLSEDEVAQMRREIDDEVARSGLPTSVKDRSADRTYDRARPYRQELLDFIEDTSLYEAMQVMRAAATALRNSDHVDARVKRELLDEVMATWLIILKLLIVLTPLMVTSRTALFENVRFVLMDHDPGRDPMEYINSVLNCLPQNVVRNHEKELASRKMAPLFFDFVERTENRVARLMMVMCVLRLRPRGWVAFVRRYILSEDKNSFYLAEVYSELRRQLAIGFVSEEERSEIRELVGVAVARHAKGAKNRNRKFVEATAKAVLDNVRQRLGGERQGRR